MNKQSTGKGNKQLDGKLITKKDFVLTKVNRAGQQAFKF